jgi:hypothetical protein
MQSLGISIPFAKGQDWLLPTDSDRLKFAALLDSEMEAADDRRELAAARKQELEELSKPMFGGVFADENALDFDLDKPHFNQDNRKMQP